MVSAVRYWHGGIPGLRPGDRILPPDVTGTTHSLLAYKADYERETGETSPQRSDRVYVTVDREDGRMFAACYPRGALYRVQPEEPVEPNPDCKVPGQSWQTPAATVLAVYDACVTESRKLSAYGIEFR